MANTRKRIKRFTNLKAYGLWIVVGILLVSSVILTIDTATSGAEIAMLEKTQSNLIQENSTLTDSLVKFSSLNSADEKAKELGFSQPGNIVYLSQKEAVAQAQQ